ncbi:TetR/AcrR family transcriptional regulator [Lachnospiraceae bacterium MD1]|uniref:TetR/AcrR family transcriptional regulator n=1 Tax=Variimorphobacter saccharofermentans TaxID=2755051 RepID=A0A839K2B9_9FIRM|nr:TetR/AcrR family transcriptional regulator [Variimorphobacter saccharofermentans]MBB2183944.1 TetR/AcrR family transcriptional regulator [Variimorphobacter saccharofermentans]
METKERIMMKALMLFSDRGYDGVSMRDIAAEVGIKAASIYNHFSGKEDIFSCLLSEMAIRYEQMRDNMRVPDGDMDHIAEAFADISVENLVMIARGIFLYFLNDEFAAPFRRMVTIEQYRNSIAGETYQKMFLQDAIDYEATIFASFVKEKHFVECDPYVAALHFYSPILLLLSKYDRKPEKQEEALQILDQHVKQFTELYVY